MSETTKTNEEIVETVETAVAEKKKGLGSKVKAGAAWVWDKTKPARDLAFDAVEGLLIGGAMAAGMVIVFNAEAERQEKAKKKKIFGKKQDEPTVEAQTPVVETVETPVED